MGSADDGKDQIKGKEHEPSDDSGNPQLQWKEISEGVYGFSEKEHHTHKDHTGR